MMRFCLLFILMFSCTWVNAQDYTRYLSGQINYGSIILHSQELRPIGASNPVGISLDYGKHKSSQKAWDACNCYPRSGVSLTIWDFDNREVLGYGVTSLYYIQPVFRADQRFSFSIRAAAGVSVQSNTTKKKIPTILAIAHIGEFHYNWVWWLITDSMATGPLICKQY